MPSFTFAVSHIIFICFYDHPTLSRKPGAFEDDDVIHVEGDVNPVRDIEIINEELRLKDEEQLNAAIEKLSRTVLRGEKKDKPEYVSGDGDHTIIVTNWFYFFS